MTRRTGAHIAEPSMPVLIAMEAMTIPAGNITQYAWKSINGIAVYNSVKDTGKGIYDFIGFYLYNTINRWQVGTGLLTAC